MVEREKKAMLSVIIKKKQLSFGAIFSIFGSVGGLLATLKDAASPQWKCGYLVNQTDWLARPYNFL